MMQRADILTRFIALVIDGFILGIITGILFGAGREVGGLISFVVGLIYSWYFWTRQNGQTPGKMVMKIRVVKDDGSHLDDTSAVVRYIGYTINSVVFMIGWIWALFDSRGKGWHDLIAGTTVIKA
ncbi:MAG: RDD family protein [Chloroflexota bacterium]|nr:RDD family protein [Chloroflexota bacterium]